MNDWLLGHQWILWLLVLYIASNTWAAENNFRTLHGLLTLIWERLNGHN